MGKKKIFSAKSSPLTTSSLSHDEKNMATKVWKILLVPASAHVGIYNL